MKMKGTLDITALRRNTMAACILTTLGVVGAGTLGPATTHAAERLASANSNRSLAGAPHVQRRTGGNRARAGVTAPSAPTQPTGTLVVENCDNSGPGSLRQALLDAVDGNIIDLTGLACGTITLANRLTTSASVTLDGPGADLLTIDGNAQDLVLRSGGAELAISGLSITNGSYSVGYGGCVYAQGNMVVTSSRVSGCVAGDGSNSSAYGAGLDVIGNLMLVDSTVSGNTANATSGVFGGGIYAGGDVYVTDGSIVSGNTGTVSGVDAGVRGGGIFTDGAAVLYQGGVVSHNVAEAPFGTAYGGGIHANGGGAVAIFSTISGNTAHSGTKWAYGGGIQAGDDFGNIPGDIILLGSTLSGNTASADCASCYIHGGGASAFGTIDAKYSTIRDNTVVLGGDSSGAARGGGLVTHYATELEGQISLQSSTVSGNSAFSPNGYGYGGGVAAMRSNVAANNSTIAFNSASSRGGGIAASNYANLGTGESVLASTIIANNQAPAGGDMDLVMIASGTLTVTGDHNLVMAAGVDVVVPGDTLASDPLLMPLANNGGATATHALATCSPALEAGSNPQPVEFDQRGTPFMREFGASADIGAFELQPDADRIFGDGFDAGPICL